MFILKSLVAVLALGLVQDSIAATPLCCTNTCGRSVKLARSGKKDCSAMLVETLHPTSTTTKYKTITKSVYATSVKPVTKTTDVTVTATASETEYSTSVSTIDVEETQTSTEISTIYETEYTTATVVSISTVSGALALAKRANPTQKPYYASQCADLGAYTKACSCIGVKPRTVTNSPHKKTIWVTRTAYKTIRATRTSLVAVVTETTLRTLTTIATIIETAEETQTITTDTTITIPATLTEATSTITEVVVSTTTRIPTPPECIGRGFGLYIRKGDAIVLDKGLGFIHSIGEGIWLRTFSGASSAFKIDENGDLQSFWSGSDLNMVVKTGSGPYQVLFTSVSSGVSYNFPTTPVNCSITGAPNYSLMCSGPTSDNYKLTICRDEYYTNNLWLYTDASQLAGMTCYGEIEADAKCINP